MNKDTVLSHSAKGTKWKNHKYTAIRNGRYIYDDGNTVVNTPTTSGMYVYKQNGRYGYESGMLNSSPIKNSVAGGSPKGIHIKGDRGSQMNESAWEFRNVQQGDVKGLETAMKKYVYSNNIRLDNDARLKGLDWEKTAKLVNKVQGTRIKQVK